MNIKYWQNFSKRDKSTLQPTGGTDISVTLKTPTSILKPTFTSASMPADVNYIQAFGRYYKVTDVTHATNDIKEFACVEDYLATRKSEIVGSSQYVERADVSGYVPRIPDNFNPPTDDIEMKTTNIINLGWSGSPTLILGVVSISGVAYYAVTNSQLNSLLGEVFDSNFISQFTSQFYGMRECLISLKKVPYSPTGHASTIHLGDQPTNVTATRIDEAIIHDDATVRLNRPSDDHESGTSYLDFSPYSIGAVYLPYVGVVPIDMEIIGDTTSLKVDYWLDQVTGDVAYKLSSDGKILGTFSGNCSASLPIAAQNYNPIGVAANVLTTIGGILTRSPALTAGGMVGAYKECALHSQINGALSSFIGNSVGTMVQACIITKVPRTWNLNENKTRCGLPIEKTLALSTITGYVKCANSSVAIDGLEEERVEVERLLDSGIYIE